MHIDITYTCYCVSKLGHYVHYYFLFFSTGDFSPFQKFLIIKVGFNTKRQVSKSMPKSALYAQQYQFTLVGLVTGSQ